LPGREAFAVYRNLHGATRAERRAAEANELAAQEHGENLTVPPVATTYLHTNIPTTASVVFVPGEHLPEWLESP